MSMFDRFLNQGGKVADLFTENSRNPFVRLGPADPDAPGLPALSREVQFFPKSRADETNLNRGAKEGFDPYAYEESQIANMSSGNVDPLTRAAILANMSSQKPQVASGAPTKRQGTVSPNRQTNAPRSSTQSSGGFGALLQQILAEPAQVEQSKEEPKGFLDRYFENPLTQLGMRILKDGVAEGSINYYEDKRAQDQAKAQREEEARRIASQERRQRLQMALQAMNYQAQDENADASRELRAQELASDRSYQQARLRLEEEAMKQNAPESRRRQAKAFLDTQLAALNQKYYVTDISTGGSVVRNDVDPAVVQAEFGAAFDTALSMLGSSGTLSPTWEE